MKVPVVIIEHSYSPLISRMFDATYPERVDGLLFLDPNTEKDVDIMRAIDVKQANRWLETRRNESRNEELLFRFMEQTSYA